MARTRMRWPKNVPRSFEFRSVEPTHLSTQDMRAWERVLKRHRVPYVAHQRQPSETGDEGPTWYFEVNYLWHAAAVATLAAYGIEATSDLGIE